MSFKLDQQALPTAPKMDLIGPEYTYHTPLWYPSLGGLTNVYERLLKSDSLLGCPATWGLSIGFRVESGPVNPKP